MVRYGLKLENSYVCDFAHTKIRESSGNANFSERIFYIRSVCFSHGMFENSAWVDEEAPKGEKRGVREVRGDGRQGLAEGTARRFAAEFGREVAAEFGKVQGEAAESPVWRKNCSYRK